jgi:hypothetical protein
MLMRALEKLSQILRILDKRPETKYGRVFQANFAIIKIISPIW